MEIAIVGAVATIVGVVLGVLFKRVRTLDSQRADFQALIEPLQKEIERLRARVESLEAGRESDWRWRGFAIQYIRDLLTWGRPFASDLNPLPAVPPEISEDV